MKFNLHSKAGALELNAGHEQGSKCRMKEWKADEQERVGECAEDEIGKGENEGTAELSGEWMMEDGRVKNDERTRKNSARRREREPRKEKRNMDAYRTRI